MSALDDRPLIADPEPFDPEVLIEEARRRQRRRRIAASWAVALVAAAAIVVGVTSGDGPPSKPRPTTGGGAPAGATVASWRELAPGGAYLDLSQIGAVTRFDGQSIVSGSGSGCDPFCTPKISASSVRSGWHVVFAARAMGSLAIERFAVVDHRLLLFNSNMGTQEYSSTNGRRWRAVRLPADMRALGLEGLASNGSRVVAIFGNRFAGGPDRAYGESDWIWTSTDGVHWHHDAGATQGEPMFDSITTTPGGFVAAGTSRLNRAAALWTSADGLSWSPSAVNAPRGGYDNLIADGSGFVLERVPTYDTQGRPPITLWWSASGRSWTSARITGLRSAYQGRPDSETFDVPQIFALSQGFVMFDAATGEIWWSQTGRTWVRERPSGGPPPIFQPLTVAVDGNSLLFAEQARRVARDIPANATTIWQLKLPTATASR